MAKAIMIQGTMSNVGKSLLTAGMCRILYKKGFTVAPFKSQNMALNSFITKDGCEIGRAQAMQAEASGIEPMVEMNPILLKPTTDIGSQVVLNGKVYGNLSAVEYYKEKNALIPAIKKAYAKLNSQFDYIVIEGAGSAAEINLKQNDIVNMGIAKMFDVPVLLVGDIDRGGVFAQLYGTLALQSEDERKYFKGTIINCFRGDAKLLENGISMLEELTKVPNIGVMPMMKIDIDDEDSLSDRFYENKKGVLDIAVVRLPKISNFTDYNHLQKNENVGLRYISNIKETGRPDCIIIPGTKSTMSDLQWMRDNGFENQIKKLAQTGTVIIGICGGYQMLGSTLRDPYSSENVGTMQGMGLLPVDTVFSRKKTTRQVKGRIQKLSGVLADLSGQEFTAYEIHMGTSKSEKSFAMLDGSEDGSCNNSVYGTYAHGIFDNSSMLQSFINSLLKAKGLNFKSNLDINYDVYKQSQYEILAKTMEENLDIDKIIHIIDRGI